MPIELSTHLTNQTLAASTFANPYGVLLTYPFGTPERAGMLEAYGNVQRILASTYSLQCEPLIQLIGQSSVSASAFRSSASRFS
jgi:hypothetical protein